MKEKEVFEIFKKFGVMVTDGHFVYTSGKHGPVYLAKQLIYKNVETTYRLCCAIAEKFSSTADIDVVVGPESGAARLSRWTARYLSKTKGHTVANISAMKVTGGFAIRATEKRKVKGRNVLVVEDILNTYGTVNQVVELIRREGGYVVGIGALCDRSDPNNRIKIPGQPRTIALARMPLEVWTAKECPLCAKGMPVNTNLGKGKEFLLRRNQTA